MAMGVENRPARKKPLPRADAFQVLWKKESPMPFSETVLGFLIPGPQGSPNTHIRE